METWISFSWMGHLAPAQALPTLIQYAILWLKTYSDKHGKWYWLSVLQRSWVQIPYRPEFFSDLISTTSSVVFVAARISYIRFFTAVHIYDFHISTIIIYVFCSSHLVYEIFYQFQQRLHVNPSLFYRMWTCFEHTLMNVTELMKDRHIDQILMCCIYVMGKVIHFFCE